MSKTINLSAIEPQVVGGGRNGVGYSVGVTFQREWDVFWTVQSDPFRHCV